MRIRALAIEQYGIFSGHEFAFPGESLHIIYGPNEAGKSTLLQLIREVLFGFPVRNRYVFADHTSEMAATATLEMADGQRVRFRRRKGRRDPVVGEYEGSGLAVNQESLHRLLGNASAELFQNVFGFSLAELAAGQQSLEQAKLSEALYGGALGGLAGFRQVLDGLEKEHESLFSPTATKREINQLLIQLRKQAKELRAAQIRPREYGQLEKEAADLDVRLQQVRQERDRIHRQQERDKKLVKAVELWNQRRLLVEELSELDVPAEFPRDGLIHFKSYRKNRDQVARELDEIQHDLNDVNAQLETLAPQVEIIDCAPRIQQVAQQLGVIRSCRTDIPKLEQKSKTEKVGVLAKLRELDPSWTLDQLGQFQVGIARVASVTALEEEWDDLSQQRRDLQTRHTALVADIADITHRLELVPADSIAAPLADLVELAAEYATRVKKIEEYEQEHRQQYARREALEQKLSAPFDGHVDNGEQLSVPLKETVVQFQLHHDELMQQLRECQSDERRAKEDLDQHQQDLAMRHARDRVPDRKELEKSRTHRENGWKLLRRKYIEGEAVREHLIEQWSIDPSVTLPDAYEISVQQADQIADQRQQHAETVARLDQLTQEIANAQQRRERARQAHVACAEAIDVWEQEWSELWEPCRLTPKTPKAMLDWLALQHQLVDLVAQIQTVQGHQDAHREWVELYLKRLSAALDDSSAAPTTQISEARYRVQQAREAAAERKSFAGQLPPKKQQRQMLERELEQLERQIEQWHTHWHVLMEELGFPPSWDVHTTTTVLAGLREARQQQEKAEEFDARVQAMQEQLTQLEHDVGVLCEAIAPHLGQLPAENAVEELVALLEQTREDLNTQKSQLQQRAKLDRQCKNKQQQKEKEQSAIDKLVRLAEVQREEAIPELARRVTKWHEKQDALHGIEQELRVIRSEEDKTDFEKALAEADEAELESQQAILANQFELADQQFNDALRAQGVAAQKLRDLDQVSQAAALAQELESTRSQFVETVDRWAPLVLARASMQRATERFQREHQSQMLVDVARLLQRMTLGRYTRISRKLDQQGSLLVHQADGNVKEPGQLSTGTREQLYLAIRLAYVLHYCREAEPLPIVMDDVLVNFDDRRAEATLDALTELSQHAQLILLTCHQHTVDLASARSPGLKPIQLGT